MSLTAGALMSLLEYESYRREHGGRLIAYCRARSQELGPALRLRFEDELTLRHRLQEVLRDGRVSDPAEVAARIAAHRQLLPGGYEWTATLCAEASVPARNRARLPPLEEAARSILLDFGAGMRVPAMVAAGPADRHPSSLGAVVGLRFGLPAAVRAALRAGCPGAIVCTHQRYAWRSPISPAMRERLRGDLHPEPGVERCTLQSA